jgi:nucleotide-binding universal stress UspA family protein
MEPFKRILCPTDFSGYAAVALREAAALALDAGAELTLLHAYQNPAYIMPMSGYVAPTADLITKLRQEIGDELEGLADDVRKQGLTVQTQVVEGTPYKCIVDHAAEWHADLIVMGTHGRTGLAHALTGSVAERVVRTAQCPVLVTRGHD